MISVRPFRRNDAAKVCRLGREFTSYLHKLGNKAPFRLTPAKFARDGFGRNRAFIGWVAVQEREIVGYLAGHPGYEIEWASRVFYVVDLYVAEHARRQGAGRLLMRAAARYAEKNGITGMVWTVDKSNRSGEDFYRSLKAEKLTRFCLMRLTNKPLLRLVRS